MVDVSGKEPTAREAVAEALVLMSPETLALAQGGAAKGDVLGELDQLFDRAGVAYDKAAAEKIREANS